MIRLDVGVTVSAPDWLGITDAASPRDISEGYTLA